MPWIAGGRRLKEEKSFYVRWWAREGLGCMGISGCRIWREWENGWERLLVGGYRAGRGRLVSFVEFIFWMVGCWMLRGW